MRPAIKHRPGSLPATLTFVLAALAAAACGDDDAASPDAATSPTTPDAAVDPTTPDAATDPTALTLPGVLSIGTSCRDIGLGPLCSVTQSGSSFTANCSGVAFTGTVQPTGAISFSSTESVGGGAGITCSGQFAAGQVSASCSRPAEGGATTCNIVSQREILPGIACLELPTGLADFELAPESGELAPVTIGACSLIQDDCVFQAECAGGVVLTGSVTATGLSFARPLTTLVRGPLSGRAPPEGQPDTRMPQFEAGVEFGHTCATRVTGSAVTGTCFAGGRSVVTDTADPAYATQSRWPITGAAVGVPASCPQLAGVNEKLFALDSCTELRDGVAGEPGIGQPVCAYRQNNCIWEVNCGNSPLLRFGGRLQPAARRLDWKLATGTPCDASFDASGTMTGRCTVPGTPACDLTEVAAVPGLAEECPELPGNGFMSRGCGGASIVCRTQLQHACNFMALCSMGPVSDLVVAGAASYQDDIERLDFNGATDRQCHATRREEISTSVPNGTTPDQFSSEWRGDCPSPALEGAGCRGGNTPGGTSGFFGLQLFFNN
jgi:hypothetical protein